MKITQLLRTLSLMGLLMLLNACGIPRLPSVSPADPLAMSPEEVVEAFYNWYLEYPGSPLSQQAYRQSPFLSDGLVQRIDRSLGDQEQPLGFDPFLYAQDRPAEFNVEAYTITDQAAQVIVHEVFGQEFVKPLTVDLIQVDGNWKIDDIWDGNPSTPDGVTRLFYSWYIRSLHEVGSSLKDGATFSSPYLSASFVEKIRQPQTDPAAADVDPVCLQPQPPDGFQAYQPVMDEDGARVKVECYWRVPEKRLEIKLEEVRLQQQEGSWKITAIDEPQPEAAGETATPAPPFSGDAPVNVYIDEEYGFSFEYLLDWTIHEEPADLEPTESPIRHSVLLMPESISAQVLAPEKPGQLIGPRPQPPFVVLVLNCNSQELVDTFPPAESEKERVMNGNQVRLRRLVTGSLQYVIVHPKRADLWILVFDHLSQDPRYAEQAQAARPALDLLLSSIEFSE